MTTKTALRVPYPRDDGRLLVFWLPDYDIKSENPVYQVDRTRLNLPENLRNTSLLWIMQAALLPFITWLLFIVPTLALKSSIPGIIDLVGQIVVFFVVLALANTLSLDLIAAGAGLEGIKREVMSGRWGLLRVSTLGMHRIVRAKHAIAQLTIWRSTCFMIGFRFALLIVVPLHLVVLQTQFGTTPLMPPLETQFPTIDDTTVMALVGVFAYCVVGITWLLEPLWRVRALTAASLIAAGASQESAVRGLVVMRYVLIFEAQTLLGFAVSVGLLYLGISGNIPLALIASTLIPLLVYNTCIRLNRRWLLLAENRLANFEA